MKFFPRNGWRATCGVGVALFVAGLIWLGKEGSGMRFDAEASGNKSEVATASVAPGASSSDGPPPSGMSSAAPSDEAAASPNAFRAWLAAYVGASATEREALLIEGRQHAHARRVVMARLIRDDPARALHEGLRLHEYAALPDELRGRVERPFSAAAAYAHYPVCDPADVAGGPVHLAALTLTDGDVDAFSYGRRAGLMSKHSIPAQGLVLDGAAALHEHALRELEVAEVAVARAWFSLGQTDPQVSFVSGQRIEGAPVVALGGGRLYHFATRAELERLNFALAELDDLPGPTAGSDALHPQAKVAPGEYSGAASTDATPEVFDFAAARAEEVAQASAWTEQPKRVFIIRVDFADVPGATHSQAQVANVLNGTVTEQIRAMSYGKTWIEGEVSVQTYRLPQTTAYYVNGGAGSSRNDELLRDARNTFRAARSGGDAAINLGPVSGTGSGGAGGLGNYDIVGVLFASIQMRSTIVYGGLAGGSNLWLQGTISDELIVHEFGHNYGIGHSSLWLTNDGSVTGSGSNVEYGDDYDIMGDGPMPDGHFHPQAKARLNWLATGDWNDATALGSATHRLYRIDAADTVGTPRGVRITRPAGVGGQQYLWLGYRPAFADRPALGRGAYVVWQRPGETRSWLLDTTPATLNDITDAPVTLGRTFADAASGAFITPLAVGGVGAETYLDVRVNFGPFPGNVPPVVGAINGPATVPARSVIGYTLVGASDANGDALAYDWSTGDGDVHPSLPSLSPTWLVGGSYTLGVTVSDMKGGTATTSRSITVTDPLDSWTVGSAGTTLDLSRLLYSQGRYLAAGFWGEAYFSWDGVAWSSAGDLPGMDQPQFAAGAAAGSGFVAVGLSEANASLGRAAWSVDGRRWRVAAVPVGTGALRAVARSATGFVAVGSGGTVLSSSDGREWTLRLVDGAPDFERLAWTGSAWIAIADHPTANRPEVVWTSSDAVTWTQRDALGVDVFSVFVRDGVYYALGWYAGVIYSDDDGLTWRDAALPAGTRWTTRRLAAAPDGTLLCAAQAMDEPGSPAALLVSLDGQRWVRKPGDGEMAAADALVFGNGRFLTVEDDGVTRRSALLYPSNQPPTGNFVLAPTAGAARQAIPFSAQASDADGDALTFAWDFGSQRDVELGAEIAPRFDFGGPYDVTLRISDGRGGLLTLTRALTVADPARTFTDRTAAAGAAGDFEALAIGGGRVLAVGSRFAGNFAGPRSWSTDGVTWQTGTVGANRSLFALAHDGTRFIGVGTQYDFGAGSFLGWIGTSPNGETWTQRRFTGPQLRAVALGGGVYLAAGEQGTVLRSTNGEAWSPVAIAGVNSSVTFAGLAWDGSVFLLTGYTGNNGGAKVFASTNGLDWLDFSAGAGVASWQDLRKVAWLNDRFVASGWYSRLRVSTDDGAAFTTTRSEVEQTPALAYGEGIYLAAGARLGGDEVNLDLLSLDGVNWSAFTAPTTAERRAAVFFNQRFITAGVKGSLWVSDRIEAQSGFAAWQTTYFPSGGLAALPTADPDGDGMANLLEYALALNPLASEPYPVAGRLAAGRVALAVALPEPARPDLVYRVEGSPSLAAGSWVELARKTGAGTWSWQAGGAARVTLGASAGGRLAVEVGLPDDQVGQPRYFLRLVVEQP